MWSGNHACLSCCVHSMRQARVHFLFLSFRCFVLVPSKTLKGFPDSAPRQSSGNSRSQRDRERRCWCIGRGPQGDACDAFGLKCTHPDLVVMTETASQDSVLNSSMPFSLSARRFFNLVVADAPYLVAPYRVTDRHGRTWYPSTVSGDFPRGDGRISCNALASSIESLILTHVPLQIIEV